MDLFEDDFTLLFKKRIPTADGSKPSILFQSNNNSHKVDKTDFPFIEGSGPLFSGDKITNRKAEHSSESLLQMNAVETKKQKLKMAKKMLKMGYSPDEVIKWIEERQK